MSDAVGRVGFIPASCTIPSAYCTSRFAALGLDRTACEAALAYPTPKAGAERVVASHHEIAAMFDAAIIEIPYPGLSAAR